MNIGITHITPYSITGAAVTTYPPLIHISAIHSILPATTLCSSPVALYDISCPTGVLLCTAIFPGHAGVPGFVLLLAGVASSPACCSVDVLHNCTLLGSLGAQLQVLLSVQAPI